MIEIITCSFCGRDNHNNGGARMIVGPTGSAICSDCLYEAWDEFGRRRKRGSGKVIYFYPTVAKN